MSSTLLPERLYVSRAVHRGLRMLCELRPDYPTPDHLANAILLAHLAGLPEAQEAQARWDALMTETRKKYSIKPEAPEDQIP